MPVELRSWYETFRRILRPAEFADPLRDAALKGHLRQWTRTLTKAVVETCHAMGWIAVAKEQQTHVLPITRQEYLGLDIAAFQSSVDPKSLHWQLPIAVFELENTRDINLVSYSLWKVCAVRSNLKAVFCYCSHASEIPNLLESLSKSVMSAPRITEDKVPLLLVVGTRAKAETFPDGFFQPYYWDPQWRRFRGLP